mgnify:CR=1 FL=1
MDVMKETIKRLTLTRPKDIRKSPLLMWEYSKWVNVTRDKFNAMGYGARTLAAFAIGMSPAQVSNTLNGRLISPASLEKLHAYSKSFRIQGE